MTNNVKTVAIVGNVDSGKSSLTGVLLNGMPDDGNGSARSCVFVHQHEKDSGRTSDIARHYYTTGQTIINLIDLAGHEAYLKTTVSGLTSAKPDIALVCVSDKITKMTKEHLGLCIALDIPIVIVFTKIDIQSHEQLQALIHELKQKLRATRRQMFQVKSSVDFDVAFRGCSVPFVCVSNKTLTGIDLLKELIDKHPIKPQEYPPCFTIDKTYHVVGNGLVVSGYNGIPINKGDQMFIGPLHNGSFINVRVKSIHDDYRQEHSELPAGVRGCLCLTFKDRKMIRKGMILTHKVPDQICKKFKASIKIYHHHTTIKKGYNAYINAGSVRESVKFLDFFTKSGTPIDLARSGDDIIAELEFMRYCNYIQKGQKVIFREGTMRGVGVVL